MTPNELGIWMAFILLLLLSFVVAIVSGSFFYNARKERTFDGKCFTAIMGLLMLFLSAMIFYISYDIWWSNIR